MTAARTFQISDIDGSNRRTVTLAQYRAEIDAAKIRANAAARKMYGDAFVDRLPPLRIGGKVVS